MLSMETLKSSLSAISLSISGYDCPDSHFETACRDIPKASAKSSCDMPLAFLNACSLTANSIVMLLTSRPS